MKALRTLPRNVWALSLASFLRDVASEMLVHLLPLFLANVLGLRTVVIGLIDGLSETIASLTKLYSGRLSDRLGRRKALAVGGYGLSALALPLLLVARSWPGVLAYRAFDRLGKGVRTAPRDALITESVAAERRGLAFGLHRAADSAGAFVGLLIALALVWRTQESGLLLDAESFRRVVAWALVPAVLTVVVLVVAVSDVGRAAATSEEEGAPAPLGLPFRRYLIVMVLFTLGNSTDAFLVLRAQSAGASVVMVLAMLAGFNASYTLLAGPAGALSDRLDRRRLILAGWGLYALVYLGFAFAATVWQIAVLYVIYGAYYALTEGVGKALVADLTPESARGAAFGAYHMAIGLTALPASVLAGVLWQGVGAWAGFGPAAPFLFGAALTGVAGVLLWRWV
jgi:MFS family permease